MKNRTLRLLGLLLCAVLALCLIPGTEASAAEKEQLGTPTDLTWNQYADLNTQPRELKQRYGSVAWKATEPYSPDDPIQFEIKLYKDGELWTTITHGYTPSYVTGGDYVSAEMHVFKEFESGTYYFTVQAIDQTGTYASSEIAKSKTWKYTKPTEKLAAPTNLRWDTEDTIDGWPWAKWDAVDGHEPNYEVFMYYSPTKDGDRSWFHHQWWIYTTRNAPPSFFLEDGLFGPGYYFFEVRAVSNDISQISSSDYAKSEAYYWKMDVPTVSISNVSSSGKLKLSWDAVEHAEKYHVYRATSKTGTYSHLKTTTSTSFTDTTAEAGKVYYYKVRGVTQNGHKSSFSEPVYRRCDLARPEVTAANVSSSGKIKLTWDKISSAEKYLVYRRSSEESSYSRIASTTSLSYTDTAAKVGTKYYYRVMAVYSNTAANSAKSETVACTCDLARPVVNIKLKNGDPRLTWEKIPGAEKYYVYRATNKTGTYTHVKTTVTASSFTDTTAKSGKTYYYKVRAIHSNTAANSAYSAIDSITAK